MELNNSRTLAAPLPVVWDALNDPETLKACIAGCDSFARSGDNEYAMTMTARVGPVSARFSGRVTLLEVTPPTGYTLRFEGQGGPAGFANGEAKVLLAAVTDSSTNLSYAVKAQIGGKLAQIGSRLIDGAASKMADDFFTRFVERVAPAALTEVHAMDATADAVAGATASTKVPLATDGKRGWLKVAISDRGWTRYIAIVAMVALMAWMYFRSHQV